MCNDQRDRQHENTSSWTNADMDHECAQSNCQKSGTASTLASWITHLRYADIPVEVLRHSKACLLDSVACIIAGMNSHPSTVIRDVLRRGQGSSDAVSVPGTDLRMGVLGASYLGAQAANLLDFDDSSRAGAPGHPGATVVPPALALAEERGVFGTDLLRAIVIGYEVSLRIGRAVQASPERKRAVLGFSAWQTFGTVAAAASLMGLTQARIVNAFGLAGAQAPLPSIRKFVDGDPPFSWIKNCYGIASEVGMLSAMLAERDFLGNQEIFDGDTGFWVMSGSDRYRPELAVEGLGNRWMILNVGFKPYACCRWTHTLLDCLRLLAAPLRAETIVNVDVHGFRELTQGLKIPLPKSVIDAQFNARYLAALELTGRSPEYGISEADLIEPAVIDLASRIHLYHDAAADKAYFEEGALPVRVLITCESGLVLSANAEWPSGSSEAGGFPDEALNRKFLATVSTILGGDKAIRALDMIRDLENWSAGDLLRNLVTS
ncbi:MmgE/PrpD family protein [Mesorhizobium sp. M0968]|uniref:MmgE/PrpD family protein n=1 Tax=Mesorhizobium sp. M0968 TaxID=2957037 RepID=UPI003335F252